MSAPVLKPEQFACNDNGQMVEVRFGNVELTMGWEDALKVSTLLRIAAKRAQSYAGVKQKITMYGHLTDANKDEQHFQKGRDGTATFGKLSG